MDQGHRTLLPKTNSAHEEQDAASTRNLTKRASKLVTAACETCRQQKSKCDGRRPSCTHCDKQGVECEYVTDAGETRASAYKRRYNSLQEELNALQKLFSYIKSRPISDAQRIVSGIQLCQGTAEAVHLFLIQGDSIGDMEAFSEVETSQAFVTPKRTDVAPIMTKHPANVQACPWTKVAGDGLVSEIISQFFIDERPLALPIVNPTKFLEEMRVGDLDGATYCSPLLVNAICANQCYLSTDASIPSTSRMEMGQLFLDEAYTTLRSINCRASLPMAQAVNLLYQAELAKDILDVAQTAY